MRSSKLFSILVLAGGSLATSLSACTSGSPDPKADGGTGGMDSGTGTKDTGTPTDTGTGTDTGDGSHFW